MAVVVTLHAEFPCWFEQHGGAGQKGRRMSLRFDKPSSEGQQLSWYAERLGTSEV